jgi:hypothetical protein
MTPATPSQHYYASVLSQLPAPFNSVDWEFAGFAKQARKLFDADPEEIEDLELRTIVPDAFCIDRDNKCLIALEIVDSHDIDNTKAQSYCDYAFALGDTSLLVLVHYPKLQQTVGVDNFFNVSVLACRLRASGSQTTLAGRDGSSTEKCDGPPVTARFSAPQSSGRVTRLVWLKKRRHHEKPMDKGPEHSSSLWTEKRDYFLSNEGGKRANSALYRGW